MLGCSALPILGIVNPSSLTHSWHSIIHDWQVWRLFTGFYILNLQSLEGLMMAFTMFRMSKELEERKFASNTVDYAFYYFIISPCALLFSAIFTIPLMAQALSGAVAYTWSRTHRHDMTQVLFVTLPGSYYPFVALTFTYLLQGAIAFRSLLAGMACAYFYQCLESRTLGPVYKYICDCLGVEERRDPVANRLGTIHTIQQPEDGYLNAPGWFRSLVGPLLAPNRPMVKKNEKEKVGTTTSSSWSSGSFRGTGYRLGS